MLSRTEREFFHFLQQLYHIMGIVKLFGEAEHYLGREADF